MRMDGTIANESGVAYRALIQSLFFLAACVIQSFTGPCNTPTQCNTGAIELATDMHLNFFDCDDV